MGHLRACYPIVLPFVRFHDSNLSTTIQVKPVQNDKQVKIDVTTEETKKHFELSLIFQFFF